MIQKFKTQLIIALSLLTLIAPAVVGVSSASAACNSISDQLSAGANSTSTGTSTACADKGGTKATENGIASTAKQVVNILSLVIGAVAVIMIIVGGFRYIVSAGAADKVTAAKNTIVYALIGLVVVVFAQLIVHFVLNKATEVTNPASSASSTP